MTDAWYYNFVNPDSALRQELVKGIGTPDLRFIKDIVNTRIGMFTYEGDLPEGLTSQIIETALMFGNRLCFYHSVATDEWLLCRYVSGGDFDKYWKPKTVNILALNGSVVATEVPFKDIILLRDNTMDIPAFIPIKEYIGRIVEIEKDIFKMLKVACLPIVLTGNKKAANQLKQIARNLGSSDAFIYGDETIIDSIKGLNINLPYNPLDIYQLKRKYQNECLASLGIYAANDKRERLIKAEVSSENDSTDFVYMNALNERKLAIKELNKRAGLNIRVVETYIENYKADIKEEVDKVKETLKAQLEVTNKEAPDLLKEKQLSGAVPSLAKGD